MYQSCSSVINLWPPSIKYVIYITDFITGDDKTKIMWLCSCIRVGTDNSVAFSKSISTEKHILMQFRVLWSQEPEQDVFTN